MKLNILLCDRFPGLLPEYVPSYESMFIRLFRKNCPQMDFAVYDTLDGTLPEETNNNDIYLITGCNLSAYDDVGWIRDLSAWIVAADARRAKMVGICFGHQLIAQALGGRVIRSPKGWGVGIRESRLTDPEALAEFPGGHLRLLYNHHDQVVQLPERARVFATSDFCTVDGFMIDNHIITFQGHPEYTPEYAVHLIADFAADEPLKVRREALSSIGLHEHQGDLVARWIAKRY